MVFVTLSYEFSFDRGGFVFEKLFLDEDVNNAINRVTRWIDEDLLEDEKIKIYEGDAVPHADITGIDIPEEIVIDAYWIAESKLHFVIISEMDVAPRITHRVTPRDTSIDQSRGGTRTLNPATGRYTYQRF